MYNEEFKRCGKCHLNLPLTAYSLKRTGDIKKICNFCLDRARKYYNSKRCLHNKFLYHCEICREISKNIKHPNENQLKENEIM